MRIIGIRDLISGQILVATAALLLLAGCPTQEVYTPRSSGSVGLTSDDRTLFVVDADHDEVVVLDTQTSDVLARIAVGRQPERILVGPDDAVYVSLRGERSVMRIDPVTRSVVATGQVGAEPVGLGLSGDGRLLVANQASGSVSILDARTLRSTGEIEVGGHPAAVVALAGDQKAYVTDYLAGSVTVVDLRTFAVMAPVALEQPGLAEYECDRGLAPPRTAALPADVVLSPDGRRAYVAHVQSRTGSEPDARGFTQTTLALAVAPALGTLDTHRHDLLVEPLSTWIPPDHPAPLLVGTDPNDCMGAAGTGDRNMDAPSSLVVDASGEWIYLADHNSNAMAVLSARRLNRPGFVDPERGVADIVAVGARPTGIAVRGDLTAAFVHNAFDYDVSVVERVGNRLVETRRIPFGAPTLDPVVERGRRLFYSAVDPRMTEPALGGVSCSSCHPDGRTDGLSWVLPVGTHPWDRSDDTLPKATPSLWGVHETAPYLRDGSLGDLVDASHLMVTNMGGLGLSASEAGDVMAYLRTIPMPDNAHAERLPTGLLSRGEAAFAERCGSCHAGGTLTDGRLHGLNTGIDVVTPSLRGVFATPPYLHDGSARTLDEVLRRHPADLADAPEGPKMTIDEREAIEAYLKTL
jgi:YVTN family beta-propeller protein